MSLQLKVVGLLTVIISGFVLADWAVERYVILPRFEALENESARRDMARCYHALQREIEYLALYCYDWAAWDDTYAFVETRDPAYIESNLDLDPATLGDGFQAIFVLNREGQVVWGRCWDFDRMTPTQLAYFPEERWPADHPLLAHGELSARSGIVQTEAGPMAVASSPIVRSDGKGPVRGTFVLGKLLDERVAEAVAERTGVYFDLSPRAATFPPPNSELAGEIEGQPLYVLKQPGPDPVRAYVHFDALEGSQGFTLSAQLPFSHQIYVQGEQALSYWSRSILLVGLLVLAMAAWGVRWLVTQPVGELAGRITSVDWDQGLDVYVPMKRRDEIGVLAGAFNAMMERLAAGKRRYEEADRELRASESRLRAVLGSAPDGILTLDGGGTILSANPAAERMFQYLPGTMAGIALCTVVPGLLLNDNSDHSWPQGNGSQDGEDEIEDGGVIGVRRDGTTFPLHARMSLYELDGKQRYTAVLRDITALKKLHEQLARSEHLAAIGEMSTAIAHEIKNPLAGISGALQVMRAELDEADPRRDVFQEIQQQVMRLDKAVHDLLMFARPWSASKEPCDLADVVERVIDQLEDQTAFSKVQIVLEGQVSRAVAADRGLIQQVVWNLLRNAADAMPEGGPIRVVLLEGENVARLRVIDSGSGISDEDLTRVFQPFFSTKTQGTGLGLPVCRKIMEAHGGSIEIVESGPQGTVIELSIPMEESYATTYSGR